MTKDQAMNSKMAELDRFMTQWLQKAAAAWPVSSRQPTGRLSPPDTDGWRAYSPKWDRK